MSLKPKNAISPVHVILSQLWIIEKKSTNFTVVFDNVDYVWDDFIPITQNYPYID